MTTLFDIKAYKGDIGGSKNDYLYGLEEHPNAPQQVGERRYTYSASGNPLTIEGGDVNRTLTWDAENRLRRIYDSRSGQLHLYTYNHLGERALKRYGKAQAMAVNDKDAGALLDTKDNYSAYVSPYFVGHNNRYTKHYYAGAMRIASKMGASGSTYAAGTDEPDLYFYHTDHLGSTTYITDRKEVAQYVAYTPYGETFKEYKNVTPYKFNGKELDQETGYYYYGARYYDPTTALWLGTDPLQHKYPEVGPYVFCHANPIMRIDLDGQADWKAILKGSLSVYGGYMAIESGVVLVVTPTVVSQAAGATLLSTGITAVGLGTTKIIAGLVDNGSASSIPTGVGETIGQSIDAVAGNVSSTGRTIGSVIDASFGFVSNALQGTSITLNDVIANFGVSIVDAIESITYGFQALLENNPLHIYKTDSSIKEDIVCPKDNLRVAD